MFQSVILNARTYFNFLAIISKCIVKFVTTLCRLFAVGYVSSLHFGMTPWILSDRSRMPLYATCAQMSEHVRLAAAAKEEPMLKTLGRQGCRRRGHIVRGDLRAPFCVNNLWMGSER